MVDLLEKEGATVQVVRAVDLDIAPGVTSEAVRAGDAWPDVHEKLWRADIVVVASPTWLGRPAQALEARPLGPPPE